MPAKAMARKKEKLRLFPRYTVPTIVPKKSKSEGSRSRAEGNLGTNIGGILDISITNPSSYTMRGTALDHRHGRDRVFSVRIVVKNTGKETLRNISLVASGPMVWNPKEATVAELKPGQSKTLSIYYSSKEKITPIAAELLENNWQANY